MASISSLSLSFQSQCLQPTNPALLPINLQLSGRVRLFQSGRNPHINKRRTKASGKVHIEVEYTQRSTFQGSRVSALEELVFIILFVQAAITPHFRGARMSSESGFLPLKGKLALITGGSRGIGAEIAYELGKRGADVTYLLATVYTPC